MAENNNPQDFAEKVLQSLKKASRAVDISDDNVEEDVPAASVEQFSAPASRDFVAFGSPSQGGQGPGSGGNKDLVVVPGYGGTAATSTSQINFYWNAPAVPDSTGVDTNVRATIFNYATSTTNPVLVFGGYNGTSQFKPHPTYGGGTGVTAKIWLDPFLGRIDVDQIGLNSTGVGISTDAGILTYDTTQNRIRVGISGIAKTVAFTDDISSNAGLATTAQNINLASGANNSTHYVTFSLNATGSGVALSSDAELTYNPSTNTLTATTFSGSLSGSATTAQNVNTTAATTAAAHYLLFSPVNATAAGVAVSSDATLQFNPGTNVLTTDVFSGNLSATAATATNFFGTFNGSVVGTATTAQNLNVAVASANSTHYITFSPATSGSGLATSADVDLTYNPGSNVFTAGVFSGNFSGTAATATNFFGTFNGSLSGTATTAQNTYVTAQTTGTYYPVFTNTSSTTNGVVLSVESTLSWNAATNVLTAGVFSGNFTGTAATATNFYGTFVGNSSTATTATNLNTVAATTNATHYITFSPVNGASGVAISSDTQLTYNPSTDVLSATTFTGNVSGTAVTATNIYGSLSGTATTSQNINTTAATTASTHYLLFSPVNATASGVAVSSDAQLQFNPGTNVLTADVFSGNLSGTAATATNFYGTLTGNVTGTATTAQNINVTAGGSNSNHYLTFSVNATGSGVALSTDTQLYYNPTTDTLYATNFNGAFSGTISGIASSARNVDLQSGATNASHYITFSQLSASPSGTAGVALSSDAELTYNPSTNVLSLSTGSLTANNVRVGNSANTIDTSSGNLTLDSTGGQTNINDNVVIQGNLTVQGTTLTVDSTVSTFVDPVVVLGSGVGGTHSTADNNQDRGIEFRYASGGTAITGFFGFQDTDFKFRFIPNATLAGTNVYTGNVGVIVATLEGNVSGTAVTATNFYGTLTGNVTGNLTGTATTSQNVNTVASTTNATHYMLFSPVNGASGVAVSSDAQLTYNPSTDVLSATTFSGSLSGTATTATNVNLAAGANNASHSVVFSLNATGTGVGLSSDAQLTYNPATDVLSASTFSGNVTGTAITATNFYGTFAGYGQTARSTDVTAATTNATHYVTFTVASSGSGLGQSADTNLTYNPSTNVLSTDVFSGNLSGTAATATNFYGTFVGNSSTATTSANVNTVSATTNATHYIAFSPVNGASGVAISSDAQLTYNPATDVLSASTFSGNLSGTAATATNFYGTLTGNVTGTATTAQNVNTSAATTNATHYITFSPVNGASGVAISSDAQLTYNPATNVLTADTFSGNVSGTAATVTNFYGTLTGNVTGNLTGTATTAQNVNTTAATTAGTHYLLFSPVNATASGVAVSSDAQLQFNPGTNVLTVDVFSGNLSGTAATATNFFGTFNGSLVGTATTAQNLNVNATTINATHYITFAPASSGSGLATSTDTDLTYNPGSNVFTAGVFSGNFTGTAATATNFYGTLTGNVTGNLTGTATTAQNVNVVAAASAGAHYLLLAPAASGSGLAVSSDAQLSYVPTTDTLSVSNIFGSGAGLTLSASAALTNNSYLTIQTVAGDDASTSDYFIRGITSAATSKFSVDANGNLRATTKSFDIDHPTKPGKRLVYGVLEGPEHGVYHRGTVEGKGNLLVELPDYWSKLVNEDYTVSLTTHGNYSVHIVEKSMNSFIIGLTGSVFAKKLKNIKVDYLVHGSRKDAPLIIEQDDH